MVDAFFIPKGAVVMLDSSHFMLCATFARQLINHHPHNFLLHALVHQVQPSLLLWVLLQTSTWQVDVLTGNITTRVRHLIENKDPQQIKIIDLFDCSRITNSLPWKMAEWLGTCLINSQMNISMFATMFDVWCQIQHDSQPEINATPMWVS